VHDGLPHRVGSRLRVRGFGILAFATVAQLIAGSSHADAAAPDGVRLTPDIGYRSGDHSLALSLESRGRVEVWSARSRHTDTIYAIRSRAGLSYSFEDWLAVFGQFQDARIYGLGGEASGAAALYRANSPGGTDDRTYGDHLRQLWLELRPAEGLSVRAGRQDIKLGTEAMVPEANWRYLKIKRASQRLVGTVGWTHAERSNDGFSAAYDADGHHVYAFAARPTTGVFDVDGAYRRQQDITYGGVSWTIKRDIWLPNTEIRLFGLGYEDERSVRHGGRADDVEVGTFGFSSIGVYPLGPGRVDLLLWGAYQFGDFTPPGGTRDLDHSAAAGLFEVGYQLHGMAWQPWLRVGVNVASGDGDPGDGDHETFFNMLPTNHLYYGYADQLAFQNLVDWFGQIRVKPCAQMEIELILHQFSLQNEDDLQYFGTGAFDRRAFGYGSRPSRGHTGVATELDAVVNVALHEHVSVQGGYAYMWGRGVWNAFDDEDVNFGYVQVQLEY
jgi:hypothetical protein